VISDILFRMGNRTDERELVEWELSSLSLRASPVSENPVHETTPVSPRPCNVPSSLVCRVLPLHRVLRLRCSRNVAPVPVAVTMVRCAQRPPQYPRGTPSPPSTTIPILPILPILLAPRPAPPRPAPRSPERFENGQDCDERNPKPDADLSIANQTDVYGTTVIVPAMFIETARRPRYARLIGSLMSGPNERRSSKRALAP